MIHIASVGEIIQCLLEAEAWSGAVWSANAAVAQLGKEKKMVSVSVHSINEFDYCL